MRTTITLAYVADTKRTFRYAEIVEPDHPPVVGTLYVQKSAFHYGGKAPLELTVTITDEDLHRDKFAPAPAPDTTLTEA